MTKNGSFIYGTFRPVFINEKYFLIGYIWNFHQYITMYFLGSWDLFWKKYGNGMMLFFNFLFEKNTKKIW